MSHIDHEYPDRTQRDTQLMPVLFKDGTDRRQSARIPVFGPVRMGPPGGEPYAVVSATNLSRNGLFIDADRAVRIGARFSAEIPLHGGESIYVPEAEVAYNRERVDGAGFGVRFINPPAEVVERIDREIALIEKYEPTDKVPRAPKAPSKAPSKESHEEEDTSKTEIVKLDERGKRDADRSDLAIDVTDLPEPMIPDDLGYESAIEPAIAEDDASRQEPVWWTGTPGAATRRPSKNGRAREAWEDLMYRAKAARREMIDSARHFPVLWISAGLLGMLTVAGAGGLALYQRADKDVLERVPEAIDRGFSAATQRALMGERGVPAIVQTSAHPAAAADPQEAKKPLPPLVIVDDAQASADKMIRVETDEVPPQSRTAKDRALAKRRSMDGDTKKPVAEPKSELADSKKKIAEPKREAVDVKKTDFTHRVVEALTSKGGDSKKDGAAKKSAPVDDAARVARRAVEKAAEMSDRAKAMLTSTVHGSKASAHPAKLKIDLKAGHAQVLKTHVFSAPPRFVIDLTGMDGAPALPSASGHVKNIRYGKHPDFARVVIETDAPIDNGRVSKSGQNLAVTIDYQE